MRSVRLAAALVEENCDYLLQIKGNQPDVQTALQHCLGDAHERTAGREHLRKKGDAIDRRQLWLDLDNVEYLRDTLNFPGCQIALRVDRDVIAEDGTVRLSDTRYFLTSLDPGQRSRRRTAGPRPRPLANREQPVLRQRPLVGRRPSLDAPPRPLRVARPADQRRDDRAATVPSARPTPPRGSRLHRLEPPPRTRMARNHLTLQSS